MQTPIEYIFDALKKADSTPPAELIALYARGPADLESAVKDLSSDQLRAHPVPGKWSTLEVLCHLADCEQFLAERMKRILAFEKPLLPGVDENAYKSALQYENRDPAEELALIKITRAQIAKILREQSDQAWTRQGVHTEAGLMSLKQVLIHAVFHLNHHLKFIHEKRAALNLQ
jgi:uncharacterized damage-inducible protein DinB